MGRLVCTLEHPSAPEKDPHFILYVALHAIISWWYSAQEPSLRHRNAASGLGDRGSSLKQTTQSIPPTIVFPRLRNPVQSTLYKVPCTKHPVLSTLH